MSLAATESKCLLWKSMVAMIVNGCDGKLMTAIKVIGCYGNNFGAKESQ
jgi:hypothetical protein